MARKTFAEQVNDAKVMLSGLQNNMEAVQARGINEAFATSLQSTIQSVETLNSEQEALKANLKSKTSSLNAELNSLKSQMSEAIKVVKLAIDSNNWVEFGMTAKR